MDRIIIGNLKMPLRHELQEVFAAAEKLARKNGITVSNPVIYKKSLDARKKSDIHYVYSVAADAANIKGGSLPGGFQLAGAAGTLDMKELCAKALGSERIAELMFGTDGVAARSRSENNSGADGAAARSRSMNDFGTDGAAARLQSANDSGINGVSAR